MSHSDKSSTGWCMNIQAQAKKIHSQAGQDGIIAYIFENIGTANAPPFAVEFGFNTDRLDGGSGSNVAHLVLDLGWQALLLDGRYANPEINLHQQFLTSDNIVDVFERHNVPREPDYVSIDIDSCDLWVMESILKSYRPRLVSVEYNANFPIERAITMMNSKDVRFQGTRAYGASLKALDMVASENGYCLVAVQRTLDAFFVRRDLIKDTDIPTLEDFRTFCDIPLHRPCPADAVEMGWLIDFEAYRANVGNADAAKVGGDPEIRRICQTKPPRRRQDQPLAPETAPQKALK